MNNIIIGINIDYYVKAKHDVHLYDREFHNICLHHVNSIKHIVVQEMC